MLSFLDRFLAVVELQRRSGEVVPLTEGAHHLVNHEVAIAAQLRHLKLVGGIVLVSVILARFSCTLQMDGRNTRRQLRHQKEWRRETLPANVEDTVLGRLDLQVGYLLKCVANVDDNCVLHWLD